LGPALWVLGAGAIVLIVDCFVGLKKLTTACLILLTISSIIWIVIMIVYSSSKLVIEPGKDHGFHPMPTVELKEFVTNSGLILYVPQKGDQCWDAPLPCTPYPKLNLRLRKEGDMSSGFMLDLDMSKHP
jgi:hypothetical protein